MASESDVANGEAPAEVIDDNLDDKNAASTPSKNPAPRPPNRKKHEEEVGTLTTSIKELEDKRYKANERLRVIRESMNGLRDKRERLQADRSQIEDRLAVVNKAFDSKRNAMQKVKSNMVVPNEEALDQQVKLLEAELRRNHFKPTEEKKFITEIDKLNRSRRAIREHIVLKADFEKLKISQREIREERDQFFKERNEIKKKEDGFKSEMRELKENLDDLKVKLENLCEERKKLITEFRIQESAHRKHVAERREEQRLKRKEEKQAFEAQKQKEWEEIKASEEPYENEKALCSTLMMYCQKLDPTSEAAEVTNDNKMHQNQEDDQKENAGEATPPKDFVVYRKNNDDEDDFWFGGNTANNKKSGKKGGKKQKARNLKHNPETYQQFGKLSLQPPASSKEIHKVMAKLKDKLEYFEDLAEKERAARLANEPSTYFDFLNDDLHDEDEKKDSSKADPGAKMSAEAFNSQDQFPSLPKPAASSTTTFFNNQNDTEGTKAPSRGWEKTTK